MDEAEENNLEGKARNERFGRWDTCDLCEQNYHSVVECALGWACWKTYLGRPETDPLRRGSIRLLGNGLGSAKHHEDALIVREAILSIERRIGGSESAILLAQSSLADTYGEVGRHEQALKMRRDVYFGFLRFEGEESRVTLQVANNYASTLLDLKRFEEAKSLLRKIMPVARRVLGENHEATLRMTMNYTQTLYVPTGATLDDLREAVTRLEDTDRTARRVFGGANPLTLRAESNLRNARAALAARDGAVESIREAVEAMAARDA
jgi:hypothetical protein